jgi:hypothetical protein
LCYEDRLAGFFKKGGGIFFGIFAGDDIGGRDVNTVQAGGLDIVGLAIDVVEFFAVVSGVQQDNAIVKLAEEVICPLYEVGVGNAAGDLLVEYQYIAFFKGGPEIFYKDIVCFFGAFIEESEIDPGLFGVIEVSFGESYGVEIFLLSGDCVCIYAECV